MPNRKKLAGKEKNRKRVLYTGKKGSAQLRDGNRRLLALGAGRKCEKGCLKREKKKSKGAASQLKGGGFESARSYSDSEFSAKAAARWGRAVFERGWGGKKSERFAKGRRIDVFVEARKGKACRADPAVKNGFCERGDKKKGSRRQAPRAEKPTKDQPWKRKMRLSGKKATKPGGKKPSRSNESRQEAEGKKT